MTTEPRHSAVASENAEIPSSLKSLRIAIIHDWLPLYGGAERVLEQMLVVFPHADLFSLIDNIPAGKRGFLLDKSVRTSFIQKLPKGRTHYRSFFPLMPLAIEQFDLSSYNLIISSSYSFAKGVLSGPNQLHLCYCHSPVRYAWDLQHQYLQEAGLAHGVKSWIVRCLLHYIRLWDSRTPAGVDAFMTNSRFVARRIAKIYRRGAEVIYPPVNTATFPMHSEKQDFYLTVSRLVPYKRVSLIVEAFGRMPEKRLVVIGEGPDFLKIKSLAGPNVSVLGYQSLESVRDHMQRARGFIFAAEEDFGFAPVEALACGTPVIAFGRGGVLETVEANVTGIFFGEQTVESIIEALSRFEQMQAGFDPSILRERAERFSPARFRQEFTSFVRTQWEQFQSKP